MKIHKGKEMKPPKLLIHGEHKIGKSTWAAGAKSPLFLKCEDRLGHIDCHSTDLITHHEQVYEWLARLGTGKHEYKTVVIDTLDALEQIIFKDICEAEGAASINDFKNKRLAYAGGYKMSLMVWNNILSLLNGLNHRGMTIILIAHSLIKRFEDPVAASYDRYTPDLHDKTADTICQWVDAIGFFRFRVLTKEEELGFGKTKVKAQGGARLICWTPRPAYIAGNSYGLPEEMTLGQWSETAQLIGQSLKGGSNEGSDAGKSGGASTGGANESSNGSSGKGGDKQPVSSGEGSSLSEAVSAGIKEMGSGEGVSGQATERPRESDQRAVQGIIFPSGERKESDRPESAGLQAGGKKEAGSRAKKA